MTGKTKTSGAGRMLKLAIGLIAGLTTFAIGAQVAGAHHSEITADVECDRIIHYTATAWQTDSQDPDERTHLNVTISYTTSNGGGGSLPGGQFLPGNNFQFGGSFPWPAGNPQSVTIIVQEVGNWGSVQDPGKGLPSTPRETTVFLPDPCETTTTSTTIPETTTTTTIPETTTTTTVPETTTTTTIPATTTTTIPATTTTAPATTTTTPATTTTAPATTTTAPATTVPPTDSSVAQLPPVVPTTQPTASSGIAQGPTLTVPTGTQLPVTGSNDISEMVLVGLAMLGLGGVAMIARRRPSHS